MQSRSDLNRKLTRAMDVPMAVASLLFLGLFVATLTLPGKSPHQKWLEGTITGIWALFAIEFSVRFVLAPERRDFLRRNWLDLLAVALPVLRGLRVIRTIRALHGVGTFLTSAQGARLLSIPRAWLVLRRGVGGMRQFLRASRFAAVLALTVLVVVLAATVVLRLERGVAGANILAGGDALWWSAALVTTVASEKNPVTGPGRVVGVAVMVYGMVVFGYFMSCAVVFIQCHREDAFGSAEDKSGPHVQATTQRTDLCDGSGIRKSPTTPPPANKETEK